MPRYYMHLVDGVDTLLDPDGIEVPFEAIAEKALASARDCIAGDARDGRIDLRYRIDVHDEHDVIVHSLSSWLRLPSDSASMIRQSAIRPPRHWISMRFNSCRSCSSCSIFRSTARRWPVAN